MTNPQAPFPSDGPEGYHAPETSHLPPVDGPAQPPMQPPPPKRANALTSKPVIGVAALVVGLALGAGAGSAGGSAATVAAVPAPTVTVTATATYEAEPTEEAEDPEPEPSEEATEAAPAPEGTSYKWGQKIGFTYEDVEISVKVDAPKPSTNMFDKDNLEAKLTVCNKGSDTIEEMSAQGIGLYAEDKDGGQYDLMGAYRSPEFPVYEWDSAKLKAGKCRTGWVSFEDGKKAVRIATEVSDSTYSWSKSGK